MRIVLEQEIDDPRDSVGPVLRARAVTQHLDRGEADCGNRGDIGTLRARSANRHQSGAMTAFGIDQHQSLVGRQATHRSGPDKTRAVGDRLPRYCV